MSKLSNPGGVGASDWPHHDFDHPTKVLQIPISDEARRKVMGGNAMRLLKLPVSRPPVPKSDVEEEPA